MIAGADVFEESARALLDPQVVVELAARIPVLAGRKIESIEAKVLWIKPGRHFHAGYELRCGQPLRERVFLSVFAVGAARARRVLAKLPRHRHEVGVVGCARCSTAATEAGLLLQLFPYDYRLPALRDCLRHDWARKALSRWGEPAEIRRLAYRPGMRCQILYRFADGERLFGKIAVERERGRMARQHLHVERAVRAAAPRHLRVAPLVHCDDDIGLLVVGAAGGASVDDMLLPNCDEGEILGRVAAALAELHALPSAGLDRVYEAGDEIGLLRGWCDVVGVLFPDVRVDLARGFAAIAERCPTGSGSLALAHRDFYEKQVLLSDGATTVLDLDTACRADAEIDLGNFCAHLRLRGHQSGNASWCGHLERRFLDLYPRPFAADLVAWYQRCALLRLACVYRLRAGGADLAPALLADTRENWAGAPR